MDRNYCLIVFIVYVHRKLQNVTKVDAKKKKKGGGGNIFNIKRKKEKGSNLGSCPQVPVLDET